MLNKFIKTIHNKYYNLFRFIFFLRYLFAIFFISVTIFLTIPNFIDFKKKESFIKSYLYKNYNLKIIKIEKIIFNSLPLPNLELVNVSMNLADGSIKFETKNLKLYPRIFSIYNFQNFQLKKVHLFNNNIILEVSDLDLFIKKILNQKHDILLEDSSLKINDKKDTIVELENLKFANYGYNNNLISGNVFDQKFTIQLDNKLQKINLKLPNLGVNTLINFDNDKAGLSKGSLKSKILNTNLKFNFNYIDGVLRINNSFFRSKYLSFKNESLIAIKPFLDARSKFNIEELNTSMFKGLNIDKITKSKNLIKKLNIKNEINFDTKKFSRNLIDNLNLKVDFAYGRVNFSKKILVSDDSFDCKGNMNLLDDYPILYFDCFIVSQSKKRFLNRFSVKRKNNNQSLLIKANGNLSILNNKINFKSITVDETYNASKEDLKFFKDSFENIILDEGFEKIFDIKKIKKFILEVS
tara:strand:+ start:2117 stop:3517 length:1401 start_codon:yes stop_codon:yes gene_type:complete